MTKSISTTILQRFQSPGRSRVKSRMESLQGAAQIIQETDVGNPTTLVVEDGIPGPTAAVEATKALVVHEGKATVAVVATKALVVQETAD